MFKITTAKGKTFDSDYAVAPPHMPMAFVRIVNSNMATVMRTFKDNTELPLVQYPRFNNVKDIIDETTGIKLVLTIKETENEN